jgi:hypothetical protein
MVKEREEEGLCEIKCGKSKKKHKKIGVNTVRGSGGMGYLPLHQ